MSMWGVRVRRVPAAAAAAGGFFETECRLIFVRRRDTPRKALNKSIYVTYHHQRCMYKHDEVATADHCDRGCKAFVMCG